MVSWRTLPSSLCSERWSIWPDHFRIQDVATAPASYAEDIIQRQKGEVFKANRPSGKACSHVSIDQNCVTYPFFNLLLANRMKLWWTSGSSLLRWKLSPLLNTGPWLEEGNQHFLPKGIWWSGPWSDVRCDKQEGRLMGSGFGTCPSTYYLWDLKLLALFPRLEIRGMILGPFKD